MAARDYDDEKFLEGVKQSKSVAQLLTFLGKKAHGGNYYTIKRVLKRLNPDTSHWTGQLWSKGEQLKDWENYKKPKNFKKHFEKLKNYTCESCKLNEWLGQQIPLEVHHIDGDVTNNKLENLQCLCPNCHALTENYRGKKLKKV